MKLTIQLPFYISQWETEGKRRNKVKSIVTLFCRNTVGGIKCAATFCDLLQFSDPIVK